MDSGAACHMKSEILDFIPVSLVETDKYIEVVDGNFDASKQTGEVKIKFMVTMGQPSLLRDITYYFIQTYMIIYYILLS